MGRLLLAVAASAALYAPAAARAEEPRADIEGELPDPVRDTLRAVIGETDDPIENRFEARRRARAAAEDAVTVLRSEGYYAYEVTPEVSDSDPPRPVVRIETGPRFLIGDATIAWQGDPPAPEAATAALDAMDLESGEPGQAARVVAAEGRALAAVQKKGYADAVAEPRRVIVDHADLSVQPTYRIAAGRLVRLDGLDVTQPGRTNPAWLRRLAPWESGEVYDPDDVAEFERRLLDTGVYDTVTVALAPAEETTEEGLRPVVVSLAEREPRTIEGLASYETSEGFGVSARWTHYNLLGRADTLAVYGQLSNRDTRVGVDLALPHWRRPQQTLRTAAAAYRVRTDAYDEDGVGATVDVTRRYGRTSFVTVGASVDVTDTEEKGAGAVTVLGRNLITVGLLGDLLLDRSNDPLDPTRGWRLSARLEPTYTFGDSDLAYLRAVAQGTYYQPLDDQARTVLAGRLRLGRIFNGEVEQIPASRRFYAGGGGSVRGFPYQGVGPRLADNTPRGGVSLLEASFEVRRDITEQWGVVLFVDAGAVGSGGVFDVDDLATGAGVGIRYDLGFAPIRLDIATPVTRSRDEPAIQVYLSIGQAF